MSDRYSCIEITAPDWGTGLEDMGEFVGYNCGYCHGEGWLWNPEIIHERIKMPCPKCGGTGHVKARIAIEWQPDGEVKSYFKKKG